MAELFDPKVCFAKELKSSWSCNIKTIDANSNKIPITNVGKEICLHLQHPGDDTTWLMGLVPIQKNWESVDASDYKELVFCYYSENAKNACVGLRDEDDVDSGVVNITKRTPVEDAICEIRIPFSSFKANKDDDKKFDIRKARFIKLTGGEGDNFYISRVRIEEN